MRIRTLSLRNYRTFREATVEFGDGLTAIIGPNGAGKTTLIESMFWAMYGGSSLRLLRGPQENIRRRGSTGNVSASLEFTLGADDAGTTYLIERTLSSGGEANARLVAHGRVIARGSEPVSRKVAEILNMDWRSFIMSIYAPQKELDILSDRTPRGREAAILHILGIDDIDAVIQRVRRDGSSIARERDSRLKDIREIDGERLTRRLAALEADIRKGEESLVGLEVRRHGVDARLDALKGDITRIEDVRRRHAQLHEELRPVERAVERAEGALDTLRKKMNDILSAEKEMRSLRPALQEHAALRSRLDDLERWRGVHERRIRLHEKISRLDAEVEEVGDRLSNLERGMASQRDIEREVKGHESLRLELEKERNECEERVRELRAHRTERVSRLREIEGHRDRISALGEGGRCPTCERLLGSHYTLLMKKYEGEMAELAAEISSLEEVERGVLERLEDVKRRSDGWRAREQELDRLGTELEMKRREVERLGTVLERKRGERLALMEELDALPGTPFDEGEEMQVRKRVKRLERVRSRADELEGILSSRSETASEIRRLESELTGLNATRERLRGDIEQIPFDEDEYRALRDQVERVDRERADLNREWSDLRVELAERKGEWDKVRTEIKRRTDLNREVEDLTRQLEDLNELEGYMVEFRKYLVSRIRPFLSAHASLTLDEASEGLYPHLELDERYAITLLRDGEMRPIEEFSGGEVDLVNLCIRLSLSRLIMERSGTEINILILDEVFGSLDGQRRMSVLRCLNSLASRLSQVIVITHVEDVKESVDSYIRVERSGEESRVRLM